MNKSKVELPEPSLEHLKRLTDDTGLFQHAKFMTPLRKEGYTTDDNARAIIVANKFYAKYRDDESLRLLDKYFAFVIHSQNDDGTIRNFMNFDRTWTPDEPSSDALGRMLWAFGELLANPPSSNYIQVAKEHFDLSTPLIEKQSIRGMAYSILGLAGYLSRFPDADNKPQYLAKTADAIIKRFEQNNQPHWCWFEDVLTYDNAMLPYAFFIAAITLNEKKYLEIAQKTCEFLLTHTFNGRHFSFIGSQGWFPRGGQRTQFDQQPIEAAGTILMLKAAYQATGDKKYLKLQRKAFDWFMGENDLGVPLYDEISRGCSDGLGAGGVSENKGAESTISFLLGLLTMREGES